MGGAAPFVMAGPKFEWVQTAKHTYVLMPATLITDGNVESALWSPNGAFLIVTAAQQSTTLEQYLHPPTRYVEYGAGSSVIYVYDHSTRRVRKVWESADGSLSAFNVTWLEHSNTAYVVVSQKVTTDAGITAAFGVLALDAVTGRYAWVPGMEHLPQPPDIIPSPSQPVALAVFDDTPQPPLTVSLGLGGTPVAATAGTPNSTPPPIPTYRPVGAWVFPGANNFWVVGAGGAVYHRIHTGPAPLAGVEWGADGTNWFFATQDRKTKEQTLQKLEDDGRLTTVKEPVYTAPTLPKSELWIHTKPMVAKQRKAKRGFNNVWLSSPEETYHPDVLVTPDGVRAELSPAGSAVFYVEGGVAKVRAVEVLSEEQKQDMEKAIKAEVVSTAKQVALGLLLYSSDMDDMLPGAGGLDALDPYLKNASLLDDFIYTPPSELNLGRIASPAETQIGYIEGPGGRAIAFSDGHVKWYPNP